MLPAERKAPRAGLSCEEAIACALKTMRENRENRGQSYGKGLTKMKRAGLACDKSLPKRSPSLRAKRSNPAIVTFAG
jgi:hypothetical protein